MAGAKRTRGRDCRSGGSKCTDEIPMVGTEESIVDVRKVRR